MYQTEDGSRKVDASYDGCYIYEWVSDLMVPAQGSVNAALTALIPVGFYSPGWQLPDGGWD